MATMHQRARIRTQQQQQDPGALTQTQITAYRQTGVPMSDQEATSHLLSQLSLQQLRDLHASHIAGNTAAAAIAAAKASAFAAPSCGYADTGADALDSNFASLRDLPPASIDQIQREAQMAADAELLDHIGAVLRSPWTKLFAGLLAVAATALVIGCGGSDEPPAAEHTPAIYQPRAKVTA